MKSPRATSDSICADERKETTMAATTIDIKVNCKIDVDRRTAETCLKLVEAYLNSNRNIHIYIGTRKDGTRELSFADITDWGRMSEPF